MKYFGRWEPAPFGGGGRYVELFRGDASPGEGWEEVVHAIAMQTAAGMEDWVVVKINEIDRHALAGDAPPDFAFQPTAGQRRQAKTNHRLELDDLAEKAMLRWEDLWAILTLNPQRRLVPMRAYTMCRDWPKSAVI